MIAPIDPDHIYGRTLIGAEALFAEVRDELTQTVSKSFRTLPIPSVLQRVRSFWDKCTPVLVDHLADTNLASWIGGIDQVAKHFPPWLWDHFTQELWGKRKEDPPTLKLFPMFAEDEPKLRLPIIERAATNLFKRNVMTRPQWDAAVAEEQQKAFFITADLGAKAIEVVRDALVEDIAKGGTRRSFKQELSETLSGSPLGPAHLENIYRTNIQAAYRDGKESLASNPIVANLFPYCRYIPIRDGRTRDTHAQCGRLGLNGTGIYRRDDPFWNFFTPPWGYQCRCGTQLMTIEAAARAGVQEAKDWLKSGRPPAQPEWRLEYIPFPPEPGFGGRGMVRMSIDATGREHAPAGSAKGGQFVGNTLNSAKNGERVVINGTNVDKEKNKVTVWGKTRMEFPDVETASSFLDGKIKGLHFSAPLLTETQIPIREDAKYRGRDEPWTERATGSEVLKEPIVAWHYSSKPIKAFLPQETAFYRHWTRNNIDRPGYAVLIPAGTEVTYYDDEVRVVLSTDMEIRKLKNGWAPYKEKPEGHESHSQDSRFIDADNYFHGKRVNA
jgi:hypothetical protein